MYTDSDNFENQRKSFEKQFTGVKICIKQLQFSRISNINLL